MTISKNQSQSNQKEGISRLVSEAMEIGYPQSKGRGRHATRFSVGMQLDASTDPENQAASWSVTMHNVSDSGIAFWSKQQVRIRWDIWIREFSKDNSAPWICAHVTHCTVGLKGYLVGARFEVDD